MQLSGYVPFFLPFAFSEVVDMHTAVWAGARRRPTVIVRGICRPQLRIRDWIAQYKLFRYP